MTQPPSNYRVSVKALIKDDQGRLLLVKEDDDPWWGLPGGGIDHGETIEQGLRRELSEEVGAGLERFDTRPVFVWPFYFDPKDTVGKVELPGHKLWLVYRRTFAGPVEHT